MKIITSFALFLALLPSALLRADTPRAPAEFITWPPLTAEDRAATAPAVEKDAGAEILLWRVHVVDEYNGQDLRRVFYHYVRLKIFDEKGKEKAATVDLTYNEPGAILYPAARTIRKDGTVIEVDPKTFYKRDLVRAGNRSEKSVSFAMPGAEPGAIIEYRWQQTEEDNRFRYIRLNFQRDFPIRKVMYFVRPIDSSHLVSGEEMFLLPVNCRTTPIERAEEGYLSTSVENIPAVHREPMSPSPANTGEWALLYYRRPGAKDPKKFWEEEGRILYKDWKETLKSSDEAKAAAAAAAAAPTQPEKVAALITWLRANVRGVYDPGVTGAERAAFFAKLPKERSRTSAEILKSGLALSSERPSAFGAIAAAAGIEARPALLGDRNEVVYPANMAPDRYFLDNPAVAIKSGETWQIVDLSSRFLPPGMLPWYEEGVSALVGDPKAPVFVETAFAHPEASTDSRIARLSLTSDGALEGGVVETWTGHRAEERREEARGRSAAQIEQSFHDEITRYFPESEVTGITFRNMNDLTKPLEVTYQLKSEHYAQVTGKRLLFQPMPFRRSQGVPFSATERRFPVEFPSAWKEMDQIHVVLPAGYSFDNVTSPGGLDFGKPGSYAVSMTTNTPKDPGGPAKLVTNTEFTFGKDGFLQFPVKSYASLKSLFDDIHTRDGHTVSAIQK